MKLHLITGHSRGLGAALAQAALAQGQPVLGIARHGAPELRAAAQAHGVWFEEWTGAAGDLGDGGLAVAERLRHWLAQAAPPGITELALVHNAAVLATPQALAQCPPEQTTAVLRVGLEAALHLASAVLAAPPAPCRLLFISSGLGRRAMAGSASYCAAKAGLDHLASALALELQGSPHRVCALAPGVIDTDMQCQLRGADPARFADQPRFAELHEGGALASPAAAAVQVLAYLWRGDFGVRPVADVRAV